MRYFPIALLALAGCASTQTVLNKEPKEIVQSERSQVEVAFCLANKNNTSSLDRDDGSKVILIKNNYGALGTAFTVRKNGSGSTIEVREGFNAIGIIHRQCY